VSRVDGEDVACGEQAHGVAGLLGGAAQVWGEDDPFVGDQPGVDLWLVFVSVEGGGEDPARVEGVDENALADDAAGGDVDQDGVARICFSAVASRRWRVCSVSGPHRQMTSLPASSAGRSL